MFLELKKTRALSTTLEELWLNLEESLSSFSSYTKIANSFSCWQRKTHLRIS